MDDSPALRPLLATPPQPVPPSGAAVGRGARGLLLYGGFFIIGILFAAVLTSAGIEPPTGVPLIVLLLLLLLTLWFVTLWHELGHALAARLVNWRLLAIGVGPAVLRQTPNGPRLARNPLNRFWGGYVYVIPRDDNQLRRRRLAVVAGGPLASLLLAAAATVVYMTTASRVGLWPSLLFQIVFLSWFVGVLTLAPHTSRGLTSDGGQMLQLLRGGPRVEQRMAASLLLTALVGGVRPRDLDDALFARALSATDPAATINAHYLAYWRDLDRGDVAGAAAHLDSLLAERGVTAPAAQATYAAEAAYLTARHDPTADAPATAAAWLQLSKPLGSVDSNYRRAQAAVHLAHGRAADAVAAADDALSLLRHAIDVGGAQAEREWLLADVYKRQPQQWPGLLRLLQAQGPARQRLRLPDVAVRGAADGRRGGALRPAGHSRRRHVCR